MAMVLRWFAPAALFVLLLGLLLSARDQRRQAWVELEKTLEATLLLEANARAIWLSERLDPFYPAWREEPEPLLPDLSGAGWLLLDSSGEVALHFQTRQVLYADPPSATREVDWKPDRDYFLSALAGEESVAPARTGGRRLVKTVFTPVSVKSESISTRWVLVGQVGPGSGGDSYFANLLKSQRRFWSTALPISVAGILLLVLLLRRLAVTYRLEQSLREAEESMELESLTSTLAHELRNPLSIIQSCAEIVGKREKLTPDGRELIEDLLSEVRRTQDVLSRHLHPERGDLEEVENLPDFCRRFWQKRQALLQTQSIRLATDIPDTPVSVRAVPDQLEKILDNLLRNSIEALPGGGEVRFTLVDRGARAELVFQDNGPGLRIASFFSREGWKYGSSKPRGKGVGLRLARKWVSKWGGRLRAGNRRRGILGRIEGAEIRIALARTGKFQAD
ncbi:MAG: HAMP domain-containing histidine kinase [Candidatus Omnitrophica bacterium]|nr:HAMP domain-containing histidine kinase [Candidatus Omnitrophota bacterium]